MVSDAEVIKAAMDALELLRPATDAAYVVHIGHARLLDAILAECHVEPIHRRDVLHYLGQFSKVVTFAHACEPHRGHA